MLVEHLDVLLVPVVVAHPALFVAQQREHLAEHLVVVLERFVAAARHLLLDVVVRLLGELEVLESQLVVDDGDVAQRVESALHVDDLLVVEDAYHVVDGVARLDVTEKGVAEALALAGALHETGDVDDVEEGGHLARRLERIDEEVETRVGHGHATLVRIDRAEGKVLGSRLQLGQYVEEGRLANIGYADA